MELSTFLKYRKGKSVRTQNLSENNLLPILTPEYLRNNSEAEFTSPNGNVVVDDNEIILLWDGSNAGEFFWSKKGVLASTMVVLDFNRERFNLDYLYYSFKHFEPFLKTQTRGSGIPHVDKEVLLRHSIHELDKTEQAKIAEVLAAIDRAIAQTEALIAKHQRIKTGLMQDLLTRGIDEHGQLRDPSTHRFKSTPLGMIPEEWEVSPLGNNIKLHNNLRKPISSLVREGMKGSYPYYGATGIVDYINEYRVDGKFVLIGEDGDHFLKFRKQEMTILVEGKFNVSNHAHIIEGTSKCLTEWIFHFFAHRDLTFFLTRQGAGRFKLNKKTLLLLPIALPDPEEQSRICDVLFKAQANIEEHKRNLRKLHSLKTGLMQDLLSGRVSVKGLVEVS